MSTLTAPFLIPASMMDALKLAYATPPRAYHSFSHIEAVAHHFDEVADGPGWFHPTEVFLAVLYHDAIYDPSRKDNEARSADLARATIHTHLPTLTCDLSLVTSLIDLTARHGTLDPKALDPDAAHFLDCDMAILGAPARAFDAYDNAVAEEYRPHVPSPLYLLARRRFLSTLLLAPRIFLSDFFHHRLDAAARANLQRAVARLS